MTPASLALVWKKKYSSNRFDSVERFPVFDFSYWEVVYRGTGIEIVGLKVDEIRSLGDAFQPHMMEEVVSDQSSVRHAMNVCRVSDARAGCRWRFFALAPRSGVGANIGPALTDAMLKRYTAFGEPRKCVRRILFTPSYGNCFVGGPFYCVLEEALWDEDFIYTSMSFADEMRREFEIYPLMPDRQSVQHSLAELFVCDESRWWSRLLVQDWLATRWQSTNPFRAASIKCLPRPGSILVYMGDSWITVARLAARSPMTRIFVMSETMVLWAPLGEKVTFLPLRYGRMLLDHFLSAFSCPVELWACERSNDLQSGIVLWLAAGIKHLSRMLVPDDVGVGEYCSYFARSRFSFRSEMDLDFYLTLLNDVMEDRGEAMPSIESFRGGVVAMHPRKVDGNYPLYGLGFDRPSQQFICNFPGNGFMQPSSKDRALQWMDGEFDEGCEPVTWFVSFDAIYPVVVGHTFLEWAELAQLRGPSMSLENKCMALMWPQPTQNFLLFDIEWSEENCWPNMWIFPSTRSEKTTFDAWELLRVQGLPMTPYSSMNGKSVYYNVVPAMVRQFSSSPWVDSETNPHGVVFSTCGVPSKLQWFLNDWDADEWMTGSRDNAKEMEFIAQTPDALENGDKAWMWDRVVHPTNHALHDGEVDIIKRMMREAVICVE